MTNLKSAIDTSNSNLTNMKTDVNTTMNQAKSTNDSVNVLQSQVTLNKNNIATNTSSIANNADSANNASSLGGSTLAQVLEQAKANTQLYWIDSTSNDGVYTKHTLKLATKYKEKEYIVRDYSTATQNSNAMKVTFQATRPFSGGAASGLYDDGGTNWDITCPDGVSIHRTTDFTDCNNEANIISRIKSF